MVEITHMQARHAWRACIWDESMMITRKAPKKKKNPVQKI